MSVIVETLNGEKGLAVRWRGRSETLFPWFWLRDHGEDEASLDPGTLQRRVDTFTIPDGIRGTATAILDNGRAVEVSWSDGGPPSRYSARFLARMAGHEPGENRLLPEVARRLWSARAPLEAPPPLAAAEVMETPEGLRACLERVYRLGFAVVAGVPSDEAVGRRLFTRLGYVRETIFGGFWTLSAEVKDHGDSAYTTQYLEPHTDATYSHDAPGLQSFLCLQFDGEGGESILADGFALAEEMRSERPELFRVLSETLVPGRYLEPGVHLRAERPAIRLDPEGAVEQVSFNNYDRAPFMLPPDKMATFYKAYGDLHRRIVERGNWLTVPLRPGMALIFDNWRLLHGRMAYVGKRVFCGCYHNHENFESALRIHGATQTAGRDQV